MAATGISISIFHYHLERGGVTQVIDLAVRAMVLHLPGLEAIRLVAGRRNGAEELAGTLRPFCTEHSVSLQLVIIDDIDYQPIGSAPGPETDGVIRRLKERLIATCGGSVWLVHNFHLGKNPLFTNALLEIAEEHEEQKLCFYIHDFPECARYENLSFLKDFIPGSPYPVSGNVRYAVINGRDQRYLTDAGVRKDHVLLINNPVADVAEDDTDKAELQSRISAAFAAGFPAYVAEAPLMLYPVRTIRRKNILELGMIAALSTAPLNLVVTLPGTSATEVAYSQAVADAFGRGLIPGLWGIGDRLEQAGLLFSELMASADIIGSSSVQEGFGYLFVNAVQRGTPLFARHLDVLDGIIDVFSGHPHHFYTALRVPMSLTSTADLKRAYGAKVNRMSHLIDSDAADGIRRQIHTVIGEQDAEFSYLAVDDQLRVLEKINGEPGFAKDVRAMNQPLFHELSDLIGGGSDIPPSPGIWPFSLEAYAKSIEDLLQSYSGPTDGSTFWCPPQIQMRLIDRFAGIEYLRLLYAN